MFYDHCQNFDKVKRKITFEIYCVRNASSLSPVNMVRKKEQCIVKFDALVDGSCKKKKLNAR